MEVTLISSPRFHANGLHEEWTTDAMSDAEALVEFAGRACYQSWDKPNPATASNYDYIKHIIEVGHESVLEHANLTLYLTGVSRALTHELVRHRHFSYSQLSQRFVPKGKKTGDDVMPEIISADEESAQLFEDAMTHASSVYKRLVKRLTEIVGDGTTYERKRVRQAARSVLPNAAETKIVVTGNFRSWRHFFATRGSIHADEEIRALAVRIFEVLVQHFTAAFQDFFILPVAESDVPTLMKYDVKDLP